MKIQIITLFAVFFSLHGYSQLWKQYEDSAEALKSIKKFEKSVEYFVKAKDELNRDSLGSYTYARICNSLANGYSDLRKFDKAEPLFLEAIKIISEIRGKQNIAYTKFSTNLALTYEDMNKFEKAESLHLEIKTIREQWTGTENLDYAASCNSLGVLYWKMGKFEKILPLFNEVKRIREKLQGKNTREYASICNNIGVIYIRLGKYDEAEPLLLEAKKLRLTLLTDVHPDYLQTCNNLSALYFALKQYDKALPMFLETLEIRRKVVGEEDLGYGETCNNLGGLYEEMGLYEKAGPLLMKSKQIIETKIGKETPEYTERCNNVAAFYRKTGQLEKSESLYLEAMAIFKRIHNNDHPDYASKCLNLAILYEDMGQYHKAEQLFLEALRIHKKTIGNEDADYALSCSSLAGLYANIGEYDKAEPLFLEAKKIREKIFEKDNPANASSYQELGTLYLLMHKYKEAEPLLLEAKAIRLNKLGKEHTEYASSCTNLATLYKNLKKYNKAESLYLEANQIYEKAFGMEHPDYISSCYNLANFYNNARQADKAIYYYLKSVQTQNIQQKKLFQFTSEIEKQSYINHSNYYTNAFLSFCSIADPDLNQGYSYDVSLSGRNLVLSSTQQIRNFFHSSTDTNINRRYDLWADKRKQLSYWYSKPIENRPGYVSQLEEESNSLEKELTSLSFVFRKDKEQSEIVWKDVQKKLQPKEAAIEFISFQYFDGNRSTDSTYHIALLLTKNKPEPVLIRLFEQKQLDTLLNKSEDQKIEKKINSLYSVNLLLYNLVWKPLEKHLSGISKIYFASAGDLFKISFAALPVNDTQVLSDKYHLVQLNTTATVTDNTQNFIAASDKIQLYGGVQYNADSADITNAAKQSVISPESSRSIPADIDKGNIWNYLTGTEKEVNEIEKLGRQKNFSIDLFSGINATEESIKALNGKSSPSVLHIATHGFFFPDPKGDKRDSMKRTTESSSNVFRQSDNPLFRSGLVFAGANNAWQGKPIEGIEDGILTAYEVSNMYLPNTKLVVLSACETALGDIQGSEGVYGLQRAFKMAGVQNMVMSLWKIGDKETAEFMQLFYKNLFDKQSIEDSFYNAQTIMKTKYKNEPYKWAAWVLVK